MAPARESGGFSCAAIPSNWECVETVMEKILARLHVSKAYSNSRQEGTDTNPDPKTGT